MSRTARKSYLESVERDLRCNSKRFWSYVNSRKKTNSLPANMYFNDVRASSPQSIVGLFARQFSSMYDVAEDLDELDFVNSATRLSDIMLTGNDVYVGLLSVGDSSSSGPDGVLPIFLKSCAANLVKPLVVLFNCSLAEGVLPADWRRSFILPIFKNGDRHNVANYRPISIISTASKLLDSLVSRHIIDYITPFIRMSSTAF